jgi:hypothetical protein
MRHVPFTTLIAAAAFCMTPFGRDLLYGAFQSSEHISNSISQFLLLVVLAVAGRLALVEWGVRFYLRRRRGKIAGG